MTGNRRLNPPAVKALLGTLGVTQVELSRRTDKTEGWISHVLAGRKSASVTLQRAIADALGVPLDAITYPVAADERDEVAS